MARTQEERKAQTSARLLDAAAELFAERGVDAVSVEAVADRADRTSGAVYAHFGSKQGLLLALLDRWAAALTTTILAELEVTSDLDDRLRSVAANLIVDPCPQTRRLVRLEHELALRAAHDADVAAVLGARNRDLLRFLARGLHAWADQGLVVLPAAPETVAVVLRSVISGLTVQSQTDPGSVDLATATVALRMALGLSPAEQHRDPAATARQAAPPVTAHPAAPPVTA